MRIGIHTTTGDNGRCVIQSTSILSDGTPVSTVTVNGIEFIPKPAEPAPVDLCERPEPKEGAEVYFAGLEGGHWSGGYISRDYAYAWQRGDLHLTEEDCERAEEMKLLRARAIRARDAINGERGLPQPGERQLVVAVDRDGNVGVFLTHSAESEWRFHTKEDGQAFVDAIGGPDAFKRLIEVTV